MKYVEVTYLIATGGSGSTRMFLDTLIYWLAERPGYMIIGIKDLS